MEKNQNEEVKNRNEEVKKSNEELKNSNDLISRSDAIETIRNYWKKRLDTLPTRMTEYGEVYSDTKNMMIILEHNKILSSMITALPSAQPERDPPKRVLWTGWKGRRYTRYNCPNCKKPVRNDDVYCHRCGQRLMFPKVSHTPYVEGQKQEVIVRWDDE